MALRAVGAEERTAESRVGLLPVGVAERRDRRTWSERRDIGRDLVDLLLAGNRSLARRLGTMRTHLLIGIAPILDRIGQRFGRAEVETDRLEQGHESDTVGHVEVDLARLVGDLHLYRRAFVRKLVRPAVRDPALHRIRIAQLGQCQLDAGDRVVARRGRVEHVPRFEIFGTRDQGEAAEQHGHERDHPHHQDQRHTPVCMK